MSDVITETDPEKIWESWSRVSIEDKLRILSREKNVSTDSIIWGYKLFLERNPESQFIINPDNNAGINTLSERLLQCKEFENRLFRLKIKKEVTALESSVESIVKASKSLPELMIWQTCDPEKYWPMLKITQQTVLEYCKRHPVNYDYYVGVKKGYYSIHAAYNRIYKLNEILDSGYQGWFLYMDTDAYICDFEFRLIDYINDKTNFSMIVTPASDDSPYWDTNNGIFFVNFSHPMTSIIIKSWKLYYDSNYTEDDFRKADKWNMILNDQTSLNTILRISSLEKYIYTIGTRDLFNSFKATVIKQVLRPRGNENCFESLEDRINRISKAVEQALLKL
jgi:hypothetical protein